MVPLMNSIHLLITSALNNNYYIFSLVVLWALPLVEKEVQIHCDQATLCNIGDQKEVAWGAWMHAPSFSLKCPTQLWRQPFFQKTKKRSIPFYKPKKDRKSDRKQRSYGATFWVFYVSGGHELPKQFFVINEIFVTVFGFFALAFLHLCFNPKDQVIKTAEACNSSSSSTHFI